ncbi:MAG: cobalt-precorrin-6A reductase [Pseudomonadota bacterium]
MTRILILGGTREAAALATELVDKGHEVTTSLAGRTKEPRPVSGTVRVGGFGGVDGLVRYLGKNGIEKLVDATHPFARQISANAAQAAELTGIEFEAITRPPWQKQDGDKWIEVATLEEACDRIPPGARVLLALGSQHIDLFKRRDNVFFLVRMVDPPLNPPALPHHALVFGKPSPDWQEELNMLKENAISMIVCRNSGGPGAYAKIEAARSLGLPVLMVQR